MSTLSALIGSKLAVAVAASTVAVGGVTAAAATSSLPDPLQQAAHNLAGAPAPSGDSTAAPTTTSSGTADSQDKSDAASAASVPDVSPSATPATGPDATGPAAYGLCTAYAHGGLTAGSAAYQSLVLAAGTADGIKTYCATVKSPGRSASHRPASHPTGAPSSHPTGAPASHPTGAPASHPTGAPSSHPTGAPGSGAGTTRP